MYLKTHRSNGANSGILCVIFKNPRLHHVDLVGLLYTVSASSLTLGNAKNERNDQPTRIALSKATKKFYNIKWIIPK